MQFTTTTLQGTPRELQDLRADAMLEDATEKLAVDRIDIDLEVVNIVKSRMLVHVQQPVIHREPNVVQMDPGTVERCMCHAMSTLPWSAAARLRFEELHPRCSTETRQVTPIKQQAFSA